MFSVRRWILFFFAFLGVAGANGASFLPAIEGTVSGDLIPFDQSKRCIHWTATAATPHPDGRAVSLEIAGPGVKGAAEGKLSEDSLAWTIRAVELDLAQWFDAVATRYFPVLTGYHATGRLSATGEGVGKGSTYSGKLQIKLTEGTFSKEDGTWSLSGLSGQFDCPDFPAWTSAPRQNLLFKELTLAGLSLKNGVIEYQVEPGNRIHVYRGHVEALGGAIECEGFSLDGANSLVETSVELQGLELEALQAFLPNALAEAHGRVDARLRVRWSADQGFQFGEGTLQLRTGENARIRLAPSPGFLSAQVPARIEIAPAWMGRMGRAFSQAFPAHQTLVAIENGEESLIVESIEAELHPVEQDKDATAVLRIVAHPLKTDTVKKVRLNIKIAGPLADVLRYGLDSRVSFSP